MKVYMTSYFPDEIIQTKVNLSLFNRCLVGDFVPCIQEAGKKFFQPQNDGNGDSLDKDVYGDGSLQVDTEQYEI